MRGSNELPDISYEEFFDPPFPGTPIGNLAEAAVEGYCTFSAAYPWMLSPLGVGLRDRWCRPPAPPLPPAPTPTVGGQCCELYRVRTSVRFDDPVDPTISDSLFENLSGKIKIINDKVETAPGLFQVTIAIETGIDCPGSTPAIQSVAGGQNVGEDDIVLLSYQIEKMDGSPDNCGGSPLPTYPIPRPVPPVFDFDINVPIGGVNVTVPVTIPIIQPEINVNLRPEINIQLPDLNINLTWDGINFSFPSGGNNPDGSPPRIPNIPDNELPDGDGRPPVVPPRAPNQPVPPNSRHPTVNCPDLDLSPVIIRLDNVQEDVDQLLIIGDLLLDCSRCARTKPEDCDRDFAGSGQGAKEEIPEGAEWVEVTVTQRPENFKGYLAVGSPDVLFAGWYSFGSQSSEGDRRPIQYGSNIYPIEKGVSSFSFGLQTGYLASYYFYFPPQDEGTIN